MIDNKTERLQLPLPDVENYLEDDVARLQQALNILDKAATVDESGKIPASQLPAIAITDTFPVSSQEAMLSLSAQPGDVAIRSDVSKSFILMTAPANELGNWKELLNNGYIQAKNAISSFDGNLTEDAAWAEIPSHSNPDLGAPLNAQALVMAARTNLLRTNARESLRRSYAVAGYNLVDGSFKSGFTLVNANDVALDEESGKAYSGPAGNYQAGTGISGFIDVSNAVNTALKTIDDLRFFSGAFDGAIMSVLGHSAMIPIETPARYIFKSNSTKNDNDGTYIRPASGAGCWEMIIENNEIDVRWFGAKGDGVTDDVPAVTKCRLWMASVTFASVITMVFGGGRDYFLNSYATNAPHPWDACIHLDTNMWMKIPTGSKITFGDFRDENFFLGVSLVGATGWDGTKNTAGVPIDNVKIFGGGIVDFTKSGSMNRTSATPKARNFLAMLSNSNFRMHGLKFVGSATNGDLSNVVASLPCANYGNKVRIYDNEFVDLVCSATTNYDHSTIYVNSTDAQVYGNTFKSDLPKVKLVASACELHNSGGKFFNNTIINYTNAAIVAFMDTEHPPSVNIGSIEVYGNDVRTVRGMCYLHFDTGITVHGSVLIHDNVYKMAPYLTSAEHAQTWFASQSNRTAVTIYNSGTTGSVPNVERIKIYNNTCIENQTNFDYSATQSDTIFIAHTNNAPPKNIEIYDNYIKFSKLFGYLPNNSVPSNRKIAGWRVQRNTLDMSLVRTGSKYFDMNVAFFVDCVFEFKDPVGVPQTITGPLFAFYNNDTSFGGRSRIAVEDPDFLRLGSSVVSLGDNLFSTAFGNEIVVPASLQVNYTVDAGGYFGIAKVTNGGAPYNNSVTPGVTSITLPSYSYDGSIFSAFPRVLDAPNNNGAASGVLRAVNQGPLSGQIFVVGYKRRVNT